ncbi:MAG: rhomboid family intramembrane serine protease [Verrucomicrobiota bacterium]
MLEDRYYMRQPTFRPVWSATVVLLVVNVVAFILQNVLYRFSTFPVDRWFALSVWGLRHGFVWQLLTYQFMHGGLLHLLLNCWAIYVFGREVEETLGLKRFLTLYFTSGVIGGLFQALAGVLLGGAFAAPVVGASAGAFGLVAAFATLYPERPLMLLLFFIIPVSMRAKFLLLFSALLTVFGLVFPMDNIAHAAHLGGMLTGLVFVRYAIHWHWHWPRFQRPRSQPVRPLVHAQRRTSAPLGQKQGGVDEDLPPDEFLSKAVDPILDKISAHGIQSLTERERRILQTAREKMDKR